MSAGCTDSGTETTPSQPKPSTPRVELLLTASDFPAGTQTETDPPDSPDETTSGTHESVTPAACTENARNPLEGIADNSMSILGATDDTHNVIYVEAVIDSTVNIAKIKDRLLRQCANVKVHDKNSDYEYKFTEVPLPTALKTTQAVAYSTGGSSSTTIKLDAIATLRGMTVYLSAVTLDSEIDKQAFDKIFTAAVDKVATAK